MSDAPLGVLLSGGLDSSLVSSIASREMKRLGLPLMSFSIGLPGESTDLLVAREVAKFVGTDHHEFHFNFKKDPYLPESILWRQKEQFSDGVGYSWIDKLVAYCDQQVSDQETNTEQTVCTMQGLEATFGVI